MRLYICIITSEHFLGAGYSQFLGHVHVFAAAIPTFTWVAFSVFVGQHGTLRLHHGGAGKILAGYQFNIFLLPLFFQTQYLIHIRIHYLHATATFELVYATFMATPFEIILHKGINDSLSCFGSSLSRTQAKYVSVIVTPGDRGGLSIGHQRGTHTRDFIGGNTHADAGFADQQTQHVLAAGHAAGYRLCEVRVITGIIAGRTVILYSNALPLKVGLEVFLEFKSTMIRAQRKGHWAVVFVCH